MKSHFLSDFSQKDSFYGPLLGELNFEGVSFEVLFRKGFALLMLPKDAETRELTFSLYEPHSRKARLACAVIEQAAKWGLLSWILPRTQAQKPNTPLCPPPLPTELLRAGKVGFLLGNPEHGSPRLVVLWQEKGRTRLAKWAAKESQKQLEAELEILAYAQKQGLAGFIQPLSIERTEKWLWVELPFLPGNFTGKIDSPSVLELLCSWITKESPSFLLGTHPFTCQLWQQAGLTYPKELQQEALEQALTPAFCHGDFASWNLKPTESTLLAFDWEWALPSGFAGLDIGYGLIQESLLAQKKSPQQTYQEILEKAQHNPALKHYLDKAGFNSPQKHRLWLATCALYRHTKPASECFELLSQLGIKAN